MKVLSWPHRIKQAASHKGLVLSQTLIERAFYKGKKEQQGHFHLHHQTLMKQTLLWTHYVHRIGSIKEKLFYTGPHQYEKRGKTKAIYLGNKTLALKKIMQNAGCRVSKKLTSLRFYLCHFSSQLLHVDLTKEYLCQDKVNKILIRVCRNSVAVLG